MQSFIPTDTQTPRHRTLKATIRVNTAGIPTSVTAAVMFAWRLFAEVALN
jgi:hypothetical protein